MNKIYIGDDLHVETHTDGVWIVDSAGLIASVVQLSTEEVDRLREELQRYADRQEVSE